MKTALPEKANRNPKIAGVPKLPRSDAAGRTCGRWYSQLSVRAANGLLRMGITSKAQAYAAVKKGTCHPSNVLALNIGWQTYREIRAWLGLPQFLSDQKVCHWRARFAYVLQREGVHLQDISKILRLRSKEHARQHVSKGGNLPSILTLIH